jgi:hypothetical protein
VSVRPPPVGQGHGRKTGSHVGCTNSVARRIPRFAASSNKCTPRRFLVAARRRICAELVGESVTASVVSDVQRCLLQGQHNSPFCRFFRHQRCRGAARLLPEIAPGMPNETTHSAYLQAFRETGATGLEPATSGRDRPVGRTGHDRLRPGVTGWSRHFLAERTGSDRLRPVRTRQSLCGTRVALLVSTQATALGTDWMCSI